MPQPYLHDHVTCVAAPATWLSRPSGQLTDGADGLYVDDRRVVSRLVVTVSAVEPAPLATHRTGAASAIFASVPQQPPPADTPALTLTRRRLAEPSGGTETVTLHNASHAEIAVDLAIHAATDFAALGDVRAARAASLDQAAADFAALGDVRAVRDAVHEQPATDLAASGDVRAVRAPSRADAADRYGGQATVERRAPEREDDAPEPQEPLEWRSPDGMTVRIQTTPAPTVTTPAGEAPAGAAATLLWHVTVPARGSWSAEVRITRTDRPPIARPKRFSTLRVAADDRRLDALVRASVQDLDALRRTDGAEAYYAAGSPWYLTLFGRDALWSARLALPLGHDVAAGTLRALAARQGVRHDPETEEEPGRILHEIRQAGTGHALPPVYYGTADATPLFVSTLAEAYRWGMPAASVRALMPNVHRAMEWVTRHDGFVAYATTGAGLTHQGWKDSDDAVQHADGRLAGGPIALSEVQAYAYRAALDAAWLLDQFPDAVEAPAPAPAPAPGPAPAPAPGPMPVSAPAPGPASAPAAGPVPGSAPGAISALAPARGAPSPFGAARDDAPASSGRDGHDQVQDAAADVAERWRAWAHGLAERFRAQFWTPEGYPAIALDGDGDRVDLVASNMGHLLGTGLLTPGEGAAVAGRLAGLCSPFGVRTASPASAGYNFLAYHLGSVWPHDNAIALLGLVRDGHGAEASAIIAALLAAAERFDYRLPELYGGDDLATPYPTACRPQAWAAAAGPAILSALLGLDVDVPAGRITFAPLAPSPVGAFRVRGLKIADGELDASVTAAGELTIHNGPVGVTFHNADGSPARIARPG